MNKKEFLIKHFIPISLFFLLSLYIYRAMLGESGAFSSSDLSRPIDLESYRRMLAPMWNEEQSVPTLSRLPQLLVYFPFILMCDILGMDTSQFIKFMFISIFVFQSLSAFYIVRFFLDRSWNKDSYRNTVIAIVAAVAFSINSFMASHLYHPFIRLSIGFAPILFLCVFLGLEKKKFRYMVIAGFIWCLMCGAVHWMAYGGLLVFLMIAIHQIYQLTEKKNLKGKIRDIGRNILSGLVVLTSFTLFSSYWLIPGRLMGDTSRYGNVVTQETLNNFFKFVSFKNLISLNASQISATKVFKTQDGFLNWNGTQNMFFIMGLSLFLFSLMGPFFQKEKKSKISLLVLLLASLFLTLAMVYWTGLGHWFVLEAPFHGIYGWAFRTPKFIQFLFIAFPFLLAFSMIGFHEKLKIFVKRKKAITTISVIGVAIIISSILLPNWPYGTGDMNGQLSQAQIPEEFFEVYDWLSEQEGDFKVLYVPTYNTLKLDWNEGVKTKKDIISMSSPVNTYYLESRHTHPSGYGIQYLENLFSLSDLSSQANIGSSDQLCRVLTDIGIKYVIFHDDNSTMDTDPSKLLKLLRSQAHMNLSKQIGIVYVFENEHYTHDDPLFISDWNSMIFGDLTDLDRLLMLEEGPIGNNSYFWADQGPFDEKLFTENIDEFIFARKPSVEEIGLLMSSKEDWYAPFDHVTHSSQESKYWSKLVMEDLNERKYERKTDRLLSDFSHGYNFVNTWATGELIDDNRLDRISLYNFDMNTSLEPFSDTLDDIKIEDGKMVAVIAEDETEQVHKTVSDPIILSPGFNKYSVEVQASGKNVNNFQVLLRFLDTDLKKVKKHFLTTMSGDFNQTFSIEMDPPSTSEYLEVQILVEGHPFQETEWSVDHISIDMLSGAIKPVSFSIPIKAKGECMVAMRSLHHRKGGSMMVSLPNSDPVYIRTNDDANRFVWDTLGPFELSNGKIEVTNIEGFNSVNVLVVIGIDEYGFLMEKAASLLSSKRLVEVYDISDAGMKEHTRDPFIPERVNLDEVGPIKFNFDPVVVSPYNFELTFLNQTDPENIEISNNGVVMQHEAKDLNKISFASGPGEIMITAVPSFKNVFEMDENWSFNNGSSKLIPEEADVSTTFKSPAIDLIGPGNFSISHEFSSNNIGRSHVKVQVSEIGSSAWRDLGYTVRNLKGDNPNKEYSFYSYFPSNISKVRLVFKIKYSEGPESYSNFNNIRIRISQEMPDIDIVSLISTKEQRNGDGSGRSILESYKKIGNAEYEVKITGNGWVTLGLREAYDEFWMVIDEDGARVGSVPVNGMLNGFSIQINGTQTFRIVYMPQKWFEIGLVITLLSIMGFSVVLICVDRIRWHPRLLSKGEE